MNKLLQLYRAKLRRLAQKPLDAKRRAEIERLLKDMESGRASEAELEGILFTRGIL